jgi:hypothetical protein
MKMVVALSVVIGILALTPAAFAQSSGTGYAGEGGVAGQVSQGGGGNEGGNGKVAGTTAASNATPSNNNGVLAFTGLDLALIAGGGLLLLVGGVALSRMVARHPA